MPEKLSHLSVIETALAGLIQRVSVLERRRHGAPFDEELIDPQSIGDQRLSKKALAKRWNQSTRTLDRERKKPGFPAGELFNGRWFWWLSKIQEHERQSFEAQLGSTAPDRSRYLRAAERQKESEAKEEASTS